MPRLALIAFAGAFIASNACIASAAPFKPCVVYTEAGKFDKSFNEMAYDGSQAFAQKTGVAVAEFEPAGEDAYPGALQSAVSAGCTDVALIGFRFQTALAAFAPQHADVRFTLFDGVVPGNNVASVLFAENEGSYLVGVAAALASKSGTVGFIGGMPAAVIERFEKGYAQGVKDTRADARVLTGLVAADPKGFSDPFAASEIARDMMRHGADVLFPAAGVSGLGALDIGNSQGALGVGVDSNQNYLYPGRMLTSMVKRLDVAIDRAFDAGRQQTFKPGITRLGLKEGGVDVVVDADNRAVWTPAIVAAVARARQAIISGQVKVASPS
ncbi:BMP family ABC transporter substrate-binding protein [Nitrospirillum sp. BR 11752]|uniref:BMP family ABC transporter substrate-binding protein n=1 Tax=Nitrospirillum sp. BR 11752 TaxID=3104293 RepID=UPI002EAB0EFC|nr:BMP family ABC transporter substrate-binding protein [Nitrospirillum sp. BR 11752]